MQTVTTTSAEETEKLGRRLGSTLKGGEVIELTSDLGGGKTTFVRGLAKGTGSEDRVASPTFTISKVYEAPAFEIHHFDFYRLNEAGLIKHELEDVLGDTKTVTVIEWSDVVADVLPEHTIKIHIAQNADGSRTISFKNAEVRVD